MRKNTLSFLLNAKKAKLLTVIFATAMAPQKYIYNHTLTLENGQTLPQVEIAYHTYGTPNADQSNVIWVCHALTANSDPMDWWPGLFGEGTLFDPNKYFIVCANILGSCYGSSGPLSINPETEKPYYSSFPQVTIRDMVKAHQLLKEHLGITKIHLGIGGSMGAYQLLEWTYSEPELFNKLCLLVTSPQESAWGIAIHETQRLAIEADLTWKDDSPNAGAIGLKAARGIGMLTYRNYQTFRATQTDNEEKLDGFRAASYINYQGEKLVKRFNAQTYRILSKAMDSHNLSRGRGKMEEVLVKIKPETVVIGISSDILCPIDEQKYLAEHIPNGRLIEIDSPYGHDGFLVEFEKISRLLKEFI